MATENNNKNLNVPNLRFPEFSGEWIHCALGDISEVTKLAGFEFTQYVTYEDSGSIIALRGLNCKNGRLDLSDVKYIDNSNLSKLTRSKLYIGDILFTYVGTVGEVAIIEENDRYYLAPNVSRIRLNNGYNPYFVKQLLHTNRFYNKIILPLIATSSQPALSMENVRKFALQIPSISEQHKISSFLTLLDKRIATQIKIIEKLESLIKGLCQKLTQQGNPNTALNEALVCCSSTLQESSVQEAGDYPVYGATGVCGYTDAPEVDGDSILIIKDGASVGVTSYASGKYSAIGTLNRLVAKRGYSLRYLYYCLKVFNFAPYRTGLAIPHIYFRDYGKAKVWCPPIEEQKRITDSLLSVDREIAIEKSLLEQLYSQKRFLLQAMFI